MKKYFLFLALIMLSSCIPVDDLEAYWDKGAVDSSFVGTWQPQNRADAQTVLIAKDGDMLRVDSSDAKEREKKDYRPEFAKIIQRSKGNKFLVISEGVKHPKSGSLIRFKMAGDTLTVYDLNAAAVEAYLKEKYPHAANIRVDDNQVKIATLDDETFKILCGIPDSKTYWSEEGLYKKLQ